MKVGDYVRTEDGYFFKVKELLEKGKYNDSDNKIVQRFKIDGLYKKNEDYIETNYIYTDWIIKSSPNIIDLIEVGDYVNGQKIYTVEHYEYDDKEDLIVLGTYENYIYEKDIKSIVTKEQFKEMEYRIGDD